MYLMLKNEPVLMFTRSDGRIKIHEIIAKELLPISLLNDCTAESFANWTIKRRISNKREGLDDVKKRFGSELLESKNLASLSDQYWIQCRDEKWKNINFFKRNYSMDVAKAFFAPEEVSKRPSSDSPDLTTAGVLRKAWIQDVHSKKSRLVKAGSMAARQHPLYEVLVAVLCEQLEIPVANYSLCEFGFKICSCCDNFIDENTDLVTAAEIYNTEKRPKDVDINSHLLRMCDKFEIPGVKKLIDNITLIDTLTGNTDRNLSNIGFIRDINTMKFLGPAPIFDSGNAYWNLDSIRGLNNSELFAGLETIVFKEYSNRYDLKNLLLDSSYEAMIENYPGFSYDKKGTLIKSIKNRNDELIKLL